VPAIGEQTGHPYTVRAPRRRKRRQPDRPAPVQPNPDQRPRFTPAQQTHNARYTADVIRDARRQAIVHHRQRVAHAIVTGRTLPPSINPRAAPAGPLRITDQRAWRASGGTNLRELQDRARKQRAARLAPGLAILNQLTRPIHAIAGETLSDVRRGGLSEILAVHAPGSKAAAERRRALSRGIQNKDKYLFSDVLRAAGVRGPAASIGGFALDTALDPVNLVPGAGGLARAGVGAAARRTGVAKIAGKAAERTRGTLPVRLARQVNPNIRPAHVLPEHFREVRDALRRSRAIAANGEKRARTVAQGIARRLPGDTHPQITDALEQRSTELLNPDERKITKFLQAEYDRIHGEEHAQGLIGEKFPEFGYSPRRPQAELEREGSRKRLSGAQLASSKARTNRRPYSEFRGSEHDIYTENAPLAYYLRARDSAVKLGRHEVIQALHRVGRVWHPGAKTAAGEEIYKFAPKRMPVKVEGDELKSLLAGGAPPGRNEYRILHPNLLRVAEQNVPQRLEGLDDVGRVWDRAQGKIKTALTVPNPQYHLTNLYGDLFNAYHGSNVVSLARSLGVSSRVLRHKAKREAALKTLDRQADPAGKGVKIGDARVSVADLLDEAERHGAIGQGFIGRDLADVLDAQGKEAGERLGRGKVTGKLGETGRKIGTGKITGRLAHPLDTIRDISQYREDGVRLATYIAARRRGLNPDRAAAWVARHHFDYADLTTLERSVLRRIFPFYTFTARNTPLQIRTLLTKPGKFANLQKVREEARKISDIPPGYEQSLRLFEQQGLPVPVPGTGQLLYPKLPAMDLSRLTVRDQGNYLMSMLTPLIKTPIELSQNYNFFFRQPIDELLNSPGPHGETVRTLKPAPGWLINAVQKIPAGQGEALLKDLHVRKYTDKRTGKRVWGWPAKLDYILKQTPASGVALQVGTGLPTSRGQTTGQKLLGYGTGLKVAPFATPQIREQRAQQAYSYLQAKAKQMRHDGDAYGPDGETRTPAYQRVLDQTRAVETVLGIRKPKKRGPSYLSRGAAAAAGGLPASRGSGLSPAAQAAIDGLRP
jgi:hypothetical protein